MNVMWTLSTNSSFLHEYYCGFYPKKFYCEVFFENLSFWVSEWAFFQKKKFGKADWTEHHHQQRSGLLIIHVGFFGF